MQKHTQYLLLGLALGVMGFWGMQNIFQNNCFGIMVRNNVNTKSGMHGAMQEMMQGLDNRQCSSFDQAFLSEMIIHHQGAIEMAESALINSQRDEVKNLAKEIISAQTKEIEQMQNWQKEWDK